MTSGSKCSRTFRKKIVARIKEQMAEGWLSKFKRNKPRRKVKRGPKLFIPKVVNIQVPATPNQNPVTKAVIFGSDNASNDDLLHAYSTWGDRNKYRMSLAGEHNTAMPIEDKDPYAHTQNIALPFTNAVRIQSVARGFLGRKRAAARLVAQALPATRTAVRQTALTRRMGLASPVVGLSPMVLEGKGAARAAAFFDGPAPSTPTTRTVVAAPNMVTPSPPPPAASSSGRRGKKKGRKITFQ